MIIMLLILSHNINYTNSYLNYYHCEDDNNSNYFKINNKRRGNYTYIILYMKGTLLLLKDIREGERVELYGSN